MALGRLRPPSRPQEAEASTAVDVDAPENPPPPKPPLWERPFVRAGVMAWAAVGLVFVAVGTMLVLSTLSVVVVPLVLALFPAAVLVPPTTALRRRGMPPTLAALIVMLIAVGLFAALFGLLAPLVANELAGLTQKLEEGYTQVRGFLARSPLRVRTLPLDQALERLTSRMAEGGPDVSVRLVEAGGRFVEGVAGFALMLFALFFYLKDGARIAAWIRDLFPRRLRADAQGIGDRVWFTIGAYIRGLLVIGFVDAVLIGTGLAVLRIPLALPLAVLVFFGALFPIVGAFLAGTVAVLVALATNGLGAAIAVLVLIVVVQQLEGHILTPILLGRATELHPLAVIAALTAGAVLLGVVGAFLSVPVAASITRAVGYLRTRPRAAPA